MRELIAELPALTVAIPAISVALPIFSVLLLSAIFHWVFVPEKKSDHPENQDAESEHAQSFSIHNATDPYGDHESFVAHDQSEHNYDAVLASADPVQRETSDQLPSLPLHGAVNTPLPPPLHSQTDFTTDIDFKESASELSGNTDSNSADRQDSKKPGSHRDLLGNPSYPTPADPSSAKSAAEAAGQNTKPNQSGELRVSLPTTRTTLAENGQHNALTIRKSDEQAHITHSLVNDQAAPHTADINAGHKDTQGQTDDHIVKDRGEKGVGTQQGSGQEASARTGAVELQLPAKSTVKGNPDTLARTETALAVSEASAHTESKAPASLDAKVQTGTATDKAGAETKSDATTHRPNDELLNLRSNSAQQRNLADNKTLTKQDQEAHTTNTAFSVTDKITKSDITQGSPDANDQASDKRNPQNFTAKPTSAPETTVRSSGQGADVTTANKTLKGELQKTVGSFGSNGSSAHSNKLASATKEQTGTAGQNNHATGSFANKPGANKSESSSQTNTSAVTSPENNERPDQLEADVKTKPSTQTSDPSKNTPATQFDSTGKSNPDLQGNGKLHPKLNKPETGTSNASTPRPKYQTAAKTRHIPSSIEAQLQLKAPEISKTAANNKFQTSTSVTNDSAEEKKLADKDKLIAELEAKLLNFQQQTSTATPKSSNNRSGTTDPQNGASESAASNTATGISATSVAASQLLTSRPQDNHSSANEKAANAQQLQFKRQFEDASQKLALNEQKIHKLQSTVSRLQASGLTESDNEPKTSHGRKTLLSKVRVLAATE